MNKTRRQVFALLGSTLLSACGAPAIVARDKNDPFEGGIGGTGIVGTLDGFGSLLINGLKVELASRTSFSTPYGAVALNDLTPGQVLTVSARKSGGGITARDVAIDYALVGPLHRVGTAASVNGIPLVGWQAARGHGRTNERVAVSGVWTPAGVRPSRIDPAPHGLDLIAGTVDAGRIGGIELRASGSLPLSGTYAVALGRMAHNSFEVERFHEGRFATLRNLELLSVDGYLEATAAAPGFRIAGLGHSFANNLRLGGIGERRAIYVGLYNGDFAARRGYLVPDQFAERQQLLRGGLKAVRSLEIS
ncbi:MAG: hypothetical protein AAGK71_08685 [Pseudomonadota bacterium]